MAVDDRHRVALRTAEEIVIAVRAKGLGRVDGHAGIGDPCAAIAVINETAQIVVVVRGRIVQGGGGELHLGSVRKGGGHFGKTQRGKMRVGDRTWLALG